ncbi:MAG: protein translocase subunit SecDF, partial [Rhizobiaceae bacterium]
MLYFSRWKTFSIWAVVILAFVFAAPNLIPQSTLDQLPSWFPKRQMTLGLDLQGGSHILLQVDRNDIIKDRIETTRDDVRTLLRDAKIGYTGLSSAGRTVQVRVTEANDLNAAKKALENLTSPISDSLFG